MVDSTRAREVRSKRLVCPRGRSVVSYFAARDSVDAEVSGPRRAYLYVVYTPYATYKSTGISEAPVACGLRIMFRDTVRAPHDLTAEAHHSRAQMMEENNGLFVVRTFANDVDARLAESVLDAHGIEAIVVSDNAAGMVPYLNMMHPVRIMVQESDVELALELIGD